MLKKQKIIFISGSGRSGTNITKNILSLHPEVLAFPFEYRFTVDPDGVLDFFRSYKYNWSPYLIDKKVKLFRDFLYKIGKRNVLKYYLGRTIKKFNNRGLALTAPPYFDWELNKWFPNYIKHVDKLFDDLIDFRYYGRWPGSSAFEYKSQIDFISYDKNLEQIIISFFDSLFGDLLKYNNTSHFVEDNTWSILYLDDIMSIIPNSKLIHVYRDPRDVVVSFMKQRWSPKNIDESILYYTSIMDKIVNNIEAYRTDTLMNVRLEDLVNKSEEVTKCICDFCELEFNDLLLNVDLSHSNQGRWEKELEFSDQQKINHLLGKYINYFGYK